MIKYKEFITESSYNTEAEIWVKNNFNVKNEVLTSLDTLIPIIEEPKNNLTSKTHLKIPLLVTKSNNHIKDGNHRYFIAKQLDIKMLPVIFIPNIPLHLNKLAIKIMALKIYQYYK